MLWFFVVFWIVLSVISTELIGTIVGILLAVFFFYAITKVHRYLTLHDDSIVLHFYFRGTQTIPISNIKSVYSYRQYAMANVFGFIYLLNGKEKKCICTAPLNLKAKRIFDFLKDKGVDVPDKAYNHIRVK